MGKSWDNLVVTDQFNVTGRGFNTPLDLVEIRRMEMSLFVVPRRLVKIKRLVDIMTVEDKKDV